MTARPEGALPGQELAQLRFTNVSNSPCTLTGFPGVELFHNGHVLGKPAIRSNEQPRTYVLAPGGQPLVAVLVDHSQCDAPLSDTVGVYVPNQTVQHRAPLQLRGCTLTINPVRPLR